MIKLMSSTQVFFILKHINFVGGNMCTESWHHGSNHIFVPGGTYFINARIYKRRYLLHASEIKELVLKMIFETAKIHEYRLHAWAVLSNHYHVVIEDIGRKVSLTPLIQRIHSKTAILLNRMDAASGRQVWFQYWDKLIISEKMYTVFLKYVNNNPVIHGIVQDAARYPFCSAKWYEEGNGFQFSI